jgi:type II secretory pathway pseudopilin PulG
MKQARGFTYLTILFVVALMGIGLALVGQMWNTSARREREAELLQVGNEYRKGIERYYLSGPRQYPRALADLIQDPRQPGVVRHLRKLYVDPITNKTEWGLVRSDDGGIAGVYSLSEEEPLKLAGFAVRDASFEGKSKYSDWQFIAAPGAAAGVAAAAQPAAKPAATRARPD